MEPTNPVQPVKRPTFLTVLCILTFIMSGFSAIGVLSNLFTGKLSADQIEEATSGLHEIANMMREQRADFAAGLYENMATMMVYTNESHYLMLFLNFLTLVLGFGGALMMWKGRRNGFHAYVLYNIVGILSIYVAVPVGEVSSFMVITQVIFSALFIFMYSRNLHWLR